MIWKEAWWLVHKEMKLDRMALISSLTISLLLGLLMTSFFISDSYINIWVDFIFIAIVPSLATLYTKRTYIDLTSIKKDLISQRMGLYRILPISVSTIAWSKTCFMLIIFSIQSILFFSALSLSLFSEVGASIFPFSLLWLGYGLFVGSSIPLLEYGFSAKILHIFSIVFSIGMIGILLIVRLYLHQSLVSWSFALVNQHGWTPSLILITAGILSTYGWNRALMQRLQTRDYV